MRVLCIDKVRPREVVVAGKLDLVWIYHPESDLKNFEIVMKQELLEQVHLIKSRRIDALKQYHTADEQCLVLLDHSYETDHLDLFKNEKIDYIVYVPQLNGKAPDHLKKQVLFMTSQ